MHIIAECAPKVSGTFLGPGWAGSVTDFQLKASQGLSFTAVLVWSGLGGCVASYCVTLWHLGNVNGNEG